MNKIWCLAVFGVLAISIAQAQSSASQGTAATSVDNSDQGLTEIIVTAQRREEKIKDVPLTVTYVSSDELQKAGVDSVRELQSVVSGLTFGGLGTVSQPAIRGVSTTLSTAGAENPNALYIDGVYQLNQVSLNEEFSDVESLEVLKGPQGTLFGRNATGGAILITTKAPSFTPEGDFTYEPGYFTGSGTSRASPRNDVKGFVTGPLIPDLLAGSVSATYDYTNGYLTDDSSGERTGEIRKENVRAKLLLTPSSVARITLTGFYINDNDQGLLNNTPVPGLSVADFFPGSVVPTQPYHVAFSPGYFSAKVRQYGASVDAVIDLDWGALRSISAYENTSAKNYNSIHGAAGSPACIGFFVCLDYTDLVSDREISQEFNFTSHKFGIFSFVSGVYYFNAAGNTFATIQEDVVPGGLSVLADEIRIKSYSFFTEGNATVTDRLTVTAGVRYNDEQHDDSAYAVDVLPVAAVKQKTFVSFTPRVSVVYALTDLLNAYATYAKGFKSGQTGVANVGTIPAYQPVQPEKLTEYEAGLKFASHSFTANGSFFYYDYQNKQEQTFTGTSDVVENTGPIHIFGIDADSNYQISQDYRVNGSVTYIPTAKYLDFPNATGQSEVFALACGGFCPGSGLTPTATFNATGNRLIRTPTWTANTTLNYKHSLQQGIVDASTTVSFASTTILDLTGVIRQSSYATVNLQGGFHFADTGWRLGLFVHNLTNKAYVINGLTSTAAFNRGYAPPREVGLSLNYKF